MPEYKNGAIVGAGGDTFTSLVITEDGANEVNSNAGGGATTFFLELAGSTDVGVNCVLNSWLTITTTAFDLSAFTWWIRVLPNTRGWLFFKEGNPPGSFRLSYYQHAGGLVEVHAHGRYVAYTGPPLAVELDVAITFDGSLLTVYEDGVSKASSSAVTTVGAWDPTKALTFGDDYTYATMAFWDNALTQPQLAQLTANTATPATLEDAGANPDYASSYWPITTGTGTTVFDVSGAPAQNLGFYGVAPALPVWVTSSQGFTMKNLIGATAGQTYRWTISTTAPGLRASTYGSMFKSVGGASLEISQSAAKKDLLVGTVSDDGTEIFCQITKDYT